MSLLNTCACSIVNIFLVHDAECWCLLLSGRKRWCLMVFDGECWCVLDSVAVCCLIEHTGAYWEVLALVIVW